MKIHKRFFVLQEAERDIYNALSAAATKHELTAVEMMKILHNLEGAHIKLLLREERHPEDPTKKADEE